VRTTGCTKNAIDVSFKASGGMAAQYGGGVNRGFTTNECHFLNSLGKPTELYVRNRFQKDIYEDGSYVIYSLGPVLGHSFRDVDVYWSPDGHGEIYEMQTSQDQAISRNEQNSGGVLFSAGAKAFGVGLSVTMSGSSTSDNTVRMEFLPTPNLTTYKVWFVAGDSGPGADGQTGLIGMVWEIPTENP
jgi:hypothetical protein